MKKILLIVLIVLLISAAAGIIFIYNYNPIDFNSLNEDKGQSVFNSIDNIDYEKYGTNFIPVSFDKIPEDLKNAVLAVEDARFYDHHGIDFRGIVRATLTNLKSGEMTEGASTITQQLARIWDQDDNINLDKSLSRKIKEALAAFQLERELTKDQILEQYLNKVYLGAGTYGVEAASKEYFDKDVWELDLAQCALIAGLPQAPSAYAPNEHLDLAKKRQEKVLDRMVDTGYITKEQSEGAKSEEIVIAQKKTDDVGSQGGYGSSNSKVIEEFMGILKDQHPNEDITLDDVMNILNTQGLRINTTVNTKIQTIALESVNKVLNKRKLKNNPTGAFVAIDSDSGAVLAYYGGNTSIDMAKTASQPGSALKPLIYAKAFQDGLINKNTIILDEPTSFGNYTPSNYGNKYYGYVTSREALVNSLNVPAVKVMDMLGVDSTIEWLKNFGFKSITDKDYGLSSALGGLTNGVSPLELTQAYDSLQNKGFMTMAYFIQSIEDSEGNVIFERITGDRQQVMESAVADDIKDILYDVVNRGTATAARCGYYTGGKTGTTNNQKNLWFVGFTGNVTSTFWIGTPERDSLNNGYSKYAAEMYGEYIKEVIDNDLIDKTKLEKVNSYDDTINIEVLNPDISDIYTHDIQNDQVIQLTVSSRELEYFQDVRVVNVTIDKETGNLFNEGNCPEDNREDKYYLWGQQPTEVCDKMHFFDKIGDFFNNGLGNQNQQDKDQKNNSNDQKLDNQTN